MRKLVLLTGAMGSGKTHFINIHGLQEYTLSIDTIRKEMFSDSINKKGEFFVKLDKDFQVWNELFRRLEIRMRDGAFTIIDSVHSKTTEFNKYEKLASLYKYRIYSISFRDVPMDLCIKRRPNQEDQIKKIYARFNTSAGKIKSFVEQVDRDNLSNLFDIKVFDANSYDNIIFFGDIHGNKIKLTEALTYYKNISNPLYVFLGDYYERGQEDVGTLELLYELSNKDNFIFLEGNHEEHIWFWANNRKDLLRSKYFKNKTIYKLPDTPEFKKKIRSFCRKLWQIGVFEKNNQKVFANHAGFPIYPENTSGIINTSDFIKGIGKYAEVEEISNVFEEVAPSNVYQVHGHRNITQLPTRVNSKVFNLENNVDSPGGSLRTVLWDGKEFYPMSFANEGFLDIKISTKNQDILVKQQNKHPEISSFNFSRKVFYEAKWNDETLKARGLYKNTETDEIVMRGYDKFFLINQPPLYDLNILSKELKYPVIAYEKYNGYLGMVSVYKDKFIFGTKTSFDNPYAEHFKEIFESRPHSSKMFNFLKRTNTTALFEVIDMEFDPHIIEYKESPQLVLLDFVKNQENFETASEMEYEYRLFDFYKNKYILGIFDTRDDLLDFYKIEKKNKTMEREGIVFVDSSNFMFKFKYKFYEDWKRRRKWLNTRLDNSKLNKQIDEEDVLFYDFLLKTYPTQYDNIILARKRFQKWEN